MQNRLPYRPLVLLLLASLILACATSPTGRRQLMLVSEQQAIAASKTAYLATMKEFADAGKLEVDPAVQQRVQRITDRLIAQAVVMRPETRDWEWRIKVVNEAETVNAWCMAGGKMAIYTGLIDKLDASDDEIAQVMGHEIAHALANHTAERMSVAMATSIGLAAVAVATDDRRRGATLAGAALAAKLAIELPNSRTSEAEADRIGIELAARAGYDPRAAVSLWQKMAKVGGGGVPQFLSTHPAPQNRERELRALIPQMMPYYEQAKASRGG